ncbi:MAG: hypothetical protein AB9844_12255 [Clostridiaceae bacterium]
MKSNEKSIKSMIEELERYYESTGFTGDYEKDLRGKTPEEIRALYREALEEDVGEFFEE